MKQHRKEDIRSEVIDRIPKGRDFTTIATSTPGIDNESRNSGGDR